MLILKLFIDNSWAFNMIILQHPILTLDLLLDQGQRLTPGSIEVAQWGPRNRWNLSTCRTLDPTCPPPVYWACAHEEQHQLEAAGDLLPCLYWEHPNTLHLGVVFPQHWGRDEEALGGDEDGLKDPRLPPALPEGHLPFPMLLGRYYRSIRTWGWEAGWEAASLPQDVTSLSSLLN